MYYVIVRIAAAARESSRGTCSHGSPAKAHEVLASSCGLNWPLRRIDAADIDCNRGAWAYQLEDNAQTVFARCWDSKCQMLVRAAAERAGRSGLSCHWSTANAHAVFANSCEAKAVIFRRAAAAIAVRSGASVYPSVAHDQAVFAMACADNWRTAAWMPLVSVST